MNLLENEKLREEDHNLLSEIALTGYTIAIKYNRFGPEHLITTYPKEWLKVYAENSFQWGDPVLLGSVFSEGDRRWSSIKVFPDIRGVLNRAQFYGLKYGATFTRLVDDQTSLLSVARPDRELDDKEMLILSTWFSSFMRDYADPPGVKPIHIEALQYQKLGLSVKQAAAEAGTTESTMKARLLGARKVLGAKHNAQAVAIAIRLKLI